MAEAALLSMQSVQLRVDNWSDCHLVQRQQCGVVLLFDGNDSCRCMMHWALLPAGACLSDHCGPKINISSEGQGCPGKAH
jgi:hypothetical protein